MDAVKTGGLIAQVRRERELTQKELAEALGLTVTELLSGQRGEEPGEKAVRDSLRLSLDQLEPQIKWWQGLFLAAALALAGLLLFLGYVWVRDNTEWLSQRETTVRALEVSERESQVARALGSAGYDLHLYEVTLADDFGGCTVRAELWTGRGALPC